MQGSQSERFMLRIRTLADIKTDRYSVRQFGRKLKQFFIDIWLDIVILVILGVTAAAVWVAPHTFNRLFPITFFNNSGDIVWTQFAYPYVSPPLNSTAVGLVCGLVPLAVILISQFWVHSFLDAAHGILGLLYSLVTGTLFQVILKKTIGGLRPHFLSVCEPQLPTDPTTIGTGFNNIMFTIDQVCRGNQAKIKNAVESFPSGHSQIAWAGLGYLAIYLFAHLRIQSQRRPSYWRMAFVFAPLLLAAYIASSLVLSYNHHGYDVIAGGLIGIFVAFFSYRMVFTSVWDGRCSSVPRCRYQDDKFNADGGLSRDTVAVNEGPVLPR